MKCESVNGEHYLPAVYILAFFYLYFRIGTVSVFYG